MLKLLGAFHTVMFIVAAFREDISAMIMFGVMANLMFIINVGVSVDRLRNRPQA